MTGVTLGQSVVPVLLFSMVTSIPSAEVGAVVRGPVASCFARGLHVSLGRDGSTPRGLGALMMS
jgi:hypothetical protein